VFYRDLRKKDSAVTKEAAHQAYRQLPVGERLPSDDDVFDAADIPGFCDGDWPTWPAQEMREWVQRLDAPLLTAKSAPQTHPAEFVAAVDAA